jgi:DNA-binding NarL/FixJ family response regulator
VIRTSRCTVQYRCKAGVGGIIFTRTRCVLFVSDVALLRQTFALVLERWTGLRTVQVESLDGERGLLADFDGDIALAVVSVDTADGPDTGLIERLHGLGLPVLAFGLEGSTDHLARALEAGANDTISLAAPVSQFVSKATQLANPAAHQCS